MADLRPIVVAAADCLALAGCGPFCGSSTEAACDSHADCTTGGCSGQICGHVSEEMISTCEYRDCYNAEAYLLQCGCVQGECRWR